MPRPRKAPAAAPTLNAGQAAYVIDRLISERRVSSSDVSRYVTEMQREITDLEQRLTRLREAHGGSSSGGGSSTASSSARRGPGRPAGSGRGPGRPAGSGRGPGRPAGSGKGRKGRPGRPPASAANAAAGASTGNEGPQQPAKRRGRKPGAGAKKASALSGEQLASRQLQGRYLALVRQFPEAKRTQYAKTAKEKGREAAIKEMQESLKK